MGATDIPRLIPMRLTDMLKCLVSRAASLCNRHHAAGNDALMHFVVCSDLAWLCRPTIPDNMPTT